VRLTATYYLDVISSWCFWAEPAWAELKKRYADRIDFKWKIALLDKTGLPISRAQEQWFYRRSGTLMRAPFMLRTDWYDEPVRPEYLAPNCVAVAARELGITDDRVRLALSYAALREGKRIGEWELAAEVGATSGGMNSKELINRAHSPEIEQRVRAETAEFHALQVTQRPTFVFDTPIGDRAVFSGFAKLAPLTAALDGMLDDAEAYISYAAHFGEPPRS
jgi:predicted DsbA family dithiol-disulfide isomerase